MATPLFSPAPDSTGRPRDGSATLVPHKADPRDRGAHPLGEGRFFQWDQRTL